MTVVGHEASVDIYQMMLHEHAFEIVCELGDGFKPECDQPAEWIFHRSCCGSHSLGCHECKDLRMANLIAVECPSCLTIHEDSTSAYTLIEPINRRGS